MSCARGASIVMGRDKHHPGPPSCQADGWVVRGPWRVVTSSSVSTPLPRSSFPGLWTDERIRAAYSEGAGTYRIVPTGVAIPRGVEDLQQLVRWAAETGTPLVAGGGGSGMAGGSVGRGVIVDLSQGFAWTKPSWERRRIWVGASVTWAQVNGAARPFGLRLPPDPASGAFATSGGLVATNAAGPRSVRCGSVRQWVEALEAVGDDGAVRRVSRGGGPGRWRLDPASSDLVRARFPRTRKNSGGYALDRFAESGDELDLLIGSEGTLAFITAVQWRPPPHPPPPARALPRLPPPGAPAGAPPPPPGPNPSAGGAPAPPCPSPGGETRGRPAPGPPPGRPGWRDAIAGLFADAADLLVRLGGTPSGEHGDGRLRAGLVERFYGAEVVALFRDLKRTYDPLGIFNPGVILPAADWAPLADLKVGPDAAPIPDDIAARLREVERTAGWSVPKLDLAREPLTPGT